MTTAGGDKFGKTETGTVWLDPARTSPFRFYQFWLNTDDRDVVRYLKFFTFKSRAEIDDAGHRPSSGRPRNARRNARWLVTSTTLVHGEAQTARAERASGILFGGDITQANLDDALTVFEDAPSTELRWPDRRADRHPGACDDRSGPVEKRGDAPDQERRRVREQPARV